MRAVVSRALFGWMIGAACLFAACGLAQAEPRVALVVGNSNYGGELGQLPNPVNDAKLMAETLRKVGFEEVEVEDADQAALKQAIVDSGDKLSGAGAGARPWGCRGPMRWGRTYASAKALLAKMARE